MYIVLNKTHKILHYLYHNASLFIVTYFIVVYYKEILVSFPLIWRDNSAETCRSHVKDCTHKL